MPFLEIAILDLNRIMWQKIKKSSSHRQMRLLKGGIKTVELSITAVNQTGKVALA